ncbi:MAG TPA: toast rack family protein [Candidatus Acidoferrales bacterium]|jgi:hypothetical protein|nr:toast rack family protein [Candidatus Acidoferrales bacterium]
MANRRSPIVFAVLLIGLGVLFLYANLRGLNAWPIVSRWWPLLLILLGLGKLWDHLRQRSHPEAAEITGLTGGAVAVLVALLFFGIALSHNRGGNRDLHEVESIDRQGADSVRVHIEMSAGQLKLSGGASKLLEATFDYSNAEWKPKVRYDVSGTRGNLTVTQEGGGFHMGTTHNDWDLRLANDVPMELKIEMGAGQGDLRLAGLALTKLNLEMGAGQAKVDLTGDWKKDLDAKIEGGVGAATIRLPKNVGVRVHASGGIGSINVHGLRQDAGEYVNDAYGKSPVTLRLSVEGGVGNINLEPGQ